MKWKSASKILGKKVIDAKRPTVIKITAQDVNAGAKKEPSSCAAARAAKRMIPNCISARVHLSRVYIEKPDHWVKYHTGEALRSEVFAFDRGGQFEPGEYSLRPPPFADTKAGKAARKARQAKQAVRKSKNGEISDRQKTPRKFHVAKGVRSNSQGYYSRSATQ